MKIIKCVHLLIIIMITVFSSCGKQSAHNPMQSLGLNTTQANLPSIVSGTSNVLPSLPLDAIQPWEKVDSHGFVVKTQNRSTSGLYPDSEFQSGVDRHLDDGVSKENGEAIRLASGNVDEKKIAWAMWRLVLGGTQPGVITLDANLGSADAKYFVAISDYKQNCWQWLGEFDTPNAIISMKSGESLSKLGNAFVVVLSYNGASVDVVGVGAHPITSGDTTPPTDVTNPKAEAVPGGLLLSWDKVVAADLAGYQITVGNKPMNSLINTNMAIVPYSQGKVFISAQDTSTNTSNPVEINVPDTLIAGDIPKINLITNLTGIQRNGKIYLKASSDLDDTIFDFDLDGDGVFETLNNWTGEIISVYKNTGILRPAVRAKDSSEIVRAFSAVSLIVTSNSRPVVDMKVDKSYGQAPLGVKYTAEFQDFDGTVDQIWWDRDGNGVYEEPIYLPISPATTTFPLTIIGITNARVRVADNDGATDVASVVVQVNPASVIKLEDDYEPDGEYIPQQVKPNTFQQQNHNIYPVGDEDWFSFWAKSGLQYTISSTSIADYDLVVYLYNQFGLCLCIDDNSGGSKQFKLEWKPITSGNYYMKVVAKNSTTTGDYTFKFNQNQQGIWPQLGQDRTHKGRSPFTGPNTNALKWSYATGSKVDSSPAIGADGTVYVGSNDRKIYAINSDGSLKWSYKTGGEIYFSSPTIGSEGTVYVGSWDRNLYAINSDGTLKWTYTTGDWIRSSPSIGNDNTIYVGSDDSKLYAINPDGTKKWVFTTSRSLVSSPAIGTDGTIFVGSHDSKLYAINPDGSLKWLYETGDEIESSPAICADGIVYVGSRDGKLYAINPDGTLKWSFTTGGGPFDWVNSSPAIGTDGTIYVGCHDNKLYAVNSNGTLKWSYTTEDWVTSSPAIGADGTIYVGSNDNKLYAINSNGSLKWSYKTGDWVLSSPAIGADGSIYFGSRDNYLYAIGPGEGY